MRARRTIVVWMGPRICRPVAPLAEAPRGYLVEAIKA
jgi:hypothetical protein